MYELLLIFYSYSSPFGIQFVRRGCMQKIFFKKTVDLNHQLHELISISVDESISYKMESQGMRAVGSIMINGEYKDLEKKQQFHESIDLDIFALFEKITDKRDFHVKVEDFDYHLIDGNLSLIIQAFVYGVQDDEDRVIESTEKNLREETDAVEESEKLLREEEKVTNETPVISEAVNSEKINQLSEPQTIDTSFSDDHDDEDLGVYYFYVVQDGDSYETIAKRYQIDEYALKDYNHDRSLTTGTIVIVPYML